MAARRTSTNTRSITNGIQSRCQDTGMRPNDHGFDDQAESKKSLEAVKNTEGLFTFATVVTVH